MSLKPRRSSRNSVSTQLTPTIISIDFLTVMPTTGMIY